MTKRRRRIMRAFKLDEISVVDRPAQVDATITVMKRHDPGVTKQSATGVAGSDSEILVEEGVLLDLRDRKRDLMDRMAGLCLLAVDMEEAEQLEQEVIQMETDLRELAQDVRSAMDERDRRADDLGKRGTPAEVAARREQLAREGRRLRALGLQTLEELEHELTTMKATLGGVRRVANMTKEYQMTKDTNSTDAAQMHREAGVVQDDVTEKHRADGESYADACKRLTFERSDAGDEYRKAAGLADRLHRQAQEEASHPGERFTVTKRFADNTCEVDVRKSAAEQEMDRLAAELRNEEPALDYYAAYAKAAERHPDVYQKAVQG
jgi:hypothetical protein